MCIDFKLIYEIFFLKEYNAESYYKQKSYNETLKLLDELNCDLEVSSFILSNHIGTEVKLQAYKAARYTNQQIRYNLGLDVDPIIEKRKKEYEMFLKRQRLRESAINENNK